MIHLQRDEDDERGGERLEDVDLPPRARVLGADGEERGGKGER